MIIVLCPHCSGQIEVESINCGIFRHAVFKHNGHQVNPHLPKEECDKLIQADSVHGCCKPFRIVHVNDVYTTEICDCI